MDSNCNVPVHVLVVVYNLIKYIYTGFVNNDDLTPITATVSDNC